jgi:hypothetical protein
MIKLFMQLSIPKVLFIRIYKNFLPVSWFCVLLTNFEGGFVRLRRYSPFLAHG